MRSYYFARKKIAYFNLNCKVINNMSKKKEMERDTQFVY